MKYIVAVDEGTTSTRAVLYGIKEGKILKQASSPISQIYPKPSFVEEDANEIYAKTLSSLAEILESVEDLNEVAGIGITNQRETVIAWDKKTGHPLYNAIVWQCRRTADFMNGLKTTHGDIIRRKTGLVMDAYFSASKIKWLLDNIPEVREKADRNQICFGTVDCYLIYKLTEGKAFVTDCTNASRTMLMNIHTMAYDSELLDIFGIKEEWLPKIVPCDKKVGEFTYKGIKIPICGVAGDQQAALIGQGCFARGSGKITYGTGLFMLYNLGDNPVISDKGLVTTVAYKIGDEKAYAFEGSVFNAGSTIGWLADNLGVIEDPKDSERVAFSVEDNGGVYFVPAFTGLGAPYWNGKATGLITGLTRGSNKAHIVRAGLESMAYSAKDLADIMKEESGVDLSEIRCDGGVSANNFLLSFQASVLGNKVVRPKEKESTAIGAAYLCGIGLNILKKDDILKLRTTGREFFAEEDDKYQRYYADWKKAINKCML